MMLSSKGARLEQMNAEIEELYRAGRDDDARRLEQRANALARQMFREAACR